MIFNQRPKFSTNDLLTMIIKLNFVLMETLGLRMIRLQHVLFWASFLFITSYISLKAYPWSFAMLRVAYISIINVAIYVYCYRVLVNQYIEKHKFFQFVFIIITLLTISVLMRFYFEKNIMQYKHVTNIAPFKNNLILLAVSFFTQAAVMLISCLLSIAANRFIAESKLIEANRKQTELELTMLKTKISPHFLLNTLNNIYYYSQQNNPNTSEAILKLSYLLQYVSYEVEAKQIALAREIEIIYALKDLFTMRFEQHLNIEISYDENELKIFSILPGVLVTLFENALKHSGIGLTNHAWIKCHVYKNDKLFIANFSNSCFTEIGANSTFYSGIGLNAVREMLSLEYGSKHNLIVHQNQTIFEVKLTLSK